MATHKIRKYTLQRGATVGDGGRCGRRLRFPSVEAAGVVTDANEDVNSVKDVVIAVNEDVNAESDVKAFDDDRKSATPVSTSLAVASDSVSGCSPGVRAAMGSPPLRAPMTSLPPSLFIVPKPTSRMQVEAGESMPPTEVATTLKQM